MKAGFLAVFVLIVVLALGWIGVANQWAMFAVFAPKMEQVRYNTFKQSQAYNDGMAEQLSKYQMEWINATPDAKASMQSVILTQYASYNENMLPPNAYSFLQQVRSYSSVTQH